MYACINMHKYVHPRILVYIRMCIHMYTYIYSLVACRVPGHSLPEQAHTNSHTTTLTYSSLKVCSMVEESTCRIFVFARRRWHVILLTVLISSGHCSAVEYTNTNTYASASYIQEYV